MLAALLGVAGTLAGTYLGFHLSEMKEKERRALRSKGYWQALEAEVEFCKNRLQGYLEDNVKAPLYRLPNSAFVTYVPDLLAEGLIDKTRLVALMGFYSEVETFNRGLERAANALDDEQRQKEHDRNRLKASRLVTDGSAYQAAALVFSPSPK